MNTNRARTPRVLVASDFATLRISNVPRTFRKIQKNEKMKSNATADVPYVLLNLLTAAGFYSMFCLRTNI